MVDSKLDVEHSQNVWDFELAQVGRRFEPLLTLSRAANLGP